MFRARVAGGKSNEACRTRNQRAGEIFMVPLHGLGHVGVAVRVEEQAVAGAEAAAVSAALFAELGVEEGGAEDLGEDLKGREKKFKWGMKKNKEKESEQSKA